MIAPTLAALERQKLDLKAQIQAEVSRHTDAISALREAHRLADFQAGLLTQNLDTSQIVLAEHVITVRGAFRHAGEDRRAILESAISDLVKGAPLLREVYFATKDYARWHGQGVQHSYGAGPAHGSVIFRIELNEPVRHALKENSTPLSDEGISAAIYYLRNIERIQEAQEAAATAAKAA